VVRQAPTELVAKLLDGYEEVANANSEYPVNLLTADALWKCGSYLLWWL